MATEDLFAQFDAEFGLGVGTENDFAQFDKEFGLAVEPAPAVQTELPLDLPTPPQPTPIEEGLPPGLKGAQFLPPETEYPTVFEPTKEGGFQEVKGVTGREELTQQVLQEPDQWKQAELLKDVTPEASESIITQIQDPTLQNFLRDKVEKVKRAFPKIGEVTRVAGKVVEETGKALLPFNDPYKSEFFSKRFGVEKRSEEHPYEIIEIEPATQEELKELANHFRDKKGELSYKGADPKQRDFITAVKRWEKNPGRQEKLKEITKKIIGAGDFLDPLDYKKFKIEERMEDLKGVDNESWAALQRGDIGFVISQGVTSAAMAGDEKLTREFMQLQKDFQKSNAASADKKAGFLKKNYLALMEMLAPMGKTAVKMMVPYIGQAWAGYEWATQGAGDTIADMVEAGVPLDSATKIGAVTGVIYAAVEQLQIKQLTNIPKKAIDSSIKKVILRIAKEKGKDWAKEVSEEGLQAFVTEIGAEIGKQQAGVSDKSFTEVFFDAGKSVIEEMKAAGVPMLALTALGFGGGVLRSIPEIEKPPGAVEGPIEPSPTEPGPEEPTPLLKPLETLEPTVTELEGVSDIEGVKPEVEEKVTAEEQKIDKAEKVEDEAAAPEEKVDDEGIDNLTNLPGRNRSRKSIDKALKEEKHLFHFDIDDFKAINEEYSHGTGDAVLKEMGKAINETFPDLERGRVGGEEFVVVLGKEDIDKVQDFIDFVGQNVHVKNEKTGESEPVSVSGGIAIGKAKDAAGKDALYADILGGKAKKAGKNQISIDTGDGKVYNIKGELKGERGYAKRYRERDFLEKGQEILGDETLSPEVRKSLAGALQGVKKERESRDKAIVPGVEKKPTEKPPTEPASVSRKVAEGKQDRPSVLEKPKEKTTSEVLLETPTRKGVVDKISTMFGEITEERAQELDDDAEFKSEEEERYYNLANKYAANLEHAAIQKDADETQRIVDKIEKEVSKISQKRKGVALPPKTRKAPVRKPAKVTPPKKAVEAVKPVVEKPIEKESGINFQGKRSFVGDIVRYGLAGTAGKLVSIDSKGHGIVETIRGDRINVKKTFRPAKVTEKAFRKYQKELKEPSSQKVPKEIETTVKKSPEELIKEAKKKIPSKMWDKVDIKVTKYYGKGKRFQKLDHGAVWEENGQLYVSINPDSSPDKIARTIFHELAGHIGAANVLKTNPKLHKRISSIYKSQQNSKLVKDIKESYEEDFKKEPERFEDNVFSEWIAYSVESHLASPKKRGAAYQVWKTIKDFLINIGVAKDSVDDVINSMVKQMKKIKDVKPGLFISPKMAKDIEKAKPKTETKEFKKWFGDSKIVDKSGKPKVVYHGTYKTNNFEEFEPTGERGFPEASYFSSSEKVASQYGTEKMFAVYVKIENPYKINAKGRNFNDIYVELLSGMNYAKENGYDGVIIKNFDDSYLQRKAEKTIADTYAVFKPTQIKHATENLGTFSETDPSIFKKKDLDQDFFSPTERAISELKQEKGVVPQIESMIRKGQLKKAEVEWMGLEEWLKESPKATKTEVLDFIRASEIVVEETVLEKEVSVKGNVALATEKLLEDKVISEREAKELTGGEILEIARVQGYYDESTKYSKYTIPGGENYREVLLKMPGAGTEQYKTGYWEVLYPEGKEVDGNEVYDTTTDKDWAEENAKRIGGTVREQVLARPKDIGEYKTPHWDEPNVFAHARLNDRTTPEGEKVLFIEEIQSDWAKEAREKGIAPIVKGARFNEDTYTWTALKDDGTVVLNADGNPFEFGEEGELSKKEAVQEFNERVRTSGMKEGVPDFPFRKNWQEFALKKILRMASEEGYDRIAWVSGEQTADRYDLGKQVEEIRAKKNADGSYSISARKDGGTVFRKDVSDGKQLGDIVGKDLAGKILEQSPEEGQKIYKGDDLKVSPAWAKNLYDKMIPKFLNKYAKKWGTKVDEIALGDKEFEGAPREMLKSLKVSKDKLWFPQSLPITPEMRESVMEGQPMFKKELKEEKEIDKREIDGVPVGKFTGVEHEAAQAYESAKDAWIGEKDVRTLRAQVEKSKLQKRIKKALGLKGYNPKARLYDQAIQIYIDSKRSPGDFEKFKDKLSSQQKYVYKLSQELSPALKKVADDISQSYQEMGFEAKENELIKSVLDNYAGRIWDLEEKKGRPTAEAMRKFGTKTGHAKARKFATIIEGWGAGYDLKVKGATNNLQILKDSLVKTIEDKRFLKALQQIKTIDGDPLVTTEQKEGYVKLEHPNLTIWKFAGQAEPDKVYGKNFFATPDGTLLERRDLYAPKKQAKNLNNILGVSRLKDTPGFKQATKYNAIFKAWILQSSFFHHLAFLRSYELGTLGKKFGELSPIQATKQGIKAIENLEPIITQLVRNGLTLGLRQDWNEELLQEKTIIGKILDKTKATKIVKDKILDLRERQAEFLFGTMGAGLKAKAAMIEYRNLTKKYPNMDTNRVAKMTANLINDDFGGLHLQRMGRNPTLQHIFRLFALAPDWTESNIRSMVKMVGAGTKEERHMYRRFWAGIATKGVLLTVMANALFSIGAEDEDDKFFAKLKRAWGTGKDWKKLRWLDVDITNLYKALGGKSDNRKYFSIIGHFKDPLKFATSTVKSAHHKGSVIYKTFFELLSGEDWAGRRFTTLPELLGIGSDLGKREAEKLRGKTVTWKRGGHGGSTLPSYLLAQARGLQPVQIQNLISYTVGEMEGFDALMNSMGLGVRTTYGGEEGRFAKNKNAIKKVKDEYKFYIEKKEPQKAREIFRKNKVLFQLDSQMKVFDKELRKLKKIRNHFEDKKDKQKVELYDKKISDLLNKFNKKFDQRTK